jgi:hypothetical protein
MPLMPFIHSFEPELDILRMCRLKNLESEDIEARSHQLLSTLFILILYPLTIRVNCEAKQSLEFTLSAIQTCSVGMLMNIITNLRH